MNSLPTLSPALRQILELFDDALAGVSFPNIDREVLKASSDRLASAQLVVAERQAALDSARQEVERERADLQKLASRALDYARVYAAEDPALLERIEAITPTTKRPRRKRRSKKRQGGEVAKDDPQLTLAKDDAAA